VYQVAEGKRRKTSRDEESFREIGGKKKFDLVVFER